MTAGCRSNRLCCVKSGTSFGDWKLSPKTPAPSTASECDNAIGQLEQALLANPRNQRAAKRLVELLEAHRPGIFLSGRYTDCQRVLSGSFQETNWVDELFEPTMLAERYRGWQELLDGRALVANLPITQLFMGQFHRIKRQYTNCNARLELFKEQGVISRLCHDCYKVQILPVDLVGLMQTYFVLRKLDLPNDNARKCMIELRVPVIYPYKGYIYSETEEEVEDCLARFRELLKELGLSNIFSGISHGCSEYGLEFPEFKYSADGAHRSFERPADWDRREADFWAGRGDLSPLRTDNNHEGMSLRDVMGLRCWIDYAQMIGDESWRVFRDRPRNIGVPQFVERVRKQAARRHAEMQELRQRSAAS